MDTQNQIDKLMNRVATLERNSFGSEPNVNPLTVFNLKKYLTGGASISARAWGANVTSIVSGATTLVALTTLDFANGITWDSAGSGFKILTAGQYMVTAMANYNGTTTGKEYQTLIYVNNIQHGSSYVQASANGAAAGPCVVDLIKLSVGDEVYLYTFHNAGANQNLFNQTQLVYLGLALV